MKKILFVALLCLSLNFAFPIVSASAELGPKDVVYGDNYIIEENINPITNDKAIKAFQDDDVGAQGVGIFIVSIAVAVIYMGFTTFRVIRRAKNEI